MRVAPREAITTILVVVFNRSPRPLGFMTERRRRSRGDSTLPPGISATKHIQLMAMFVWRYLDASGTETGTSEPFEERERAEAWLGDTWAELLDGGVEEVVLAEGDRTLYRMGLREA
jgi:hypothetical protein